MAVTFFNCAKVQITIDRYKCNSKFNSTFNPGCHLDYSGRNGSGEVAFDRGTKGSGLAAHTFKNRLRSGIKWRLFLLRAADIECSGYRHQKKIKSILCLLFFL